jgi:hypothetical protein
MGSFQGKCLQAGLKLRIVEMDRIHPLNPGLGEEGQNPALRLPVMSSAENALNG